jgi:DNA-binding MarR family transcriptional regulator
MTPSHKIEAWARLLRITQALSTAVESDLKAAGFPPIGWYDVLLELTRAGDRGLRQFELRERLMLAQYTVSRLIDRMERAGLVARAPCPEDARGQILHPTDAGLELIDEMWPIYRDAIGERFASRLSEEDTRFLNALLRRMAPEDDVSLLPG